MLLPGFKSTSSGKPDDYFGSPGINFIIAHTLKQLDALQAYEREICSLVVILHSGGVLLHARRR